MPAGMSAYVPLANITLGSTTATVTFSSISQSYRDLVLVFSGGNTTSGTIAATMNADTGTNYSYVVMRGGGSTANSNTFSSVASDTISYLTQGANSTFQGIYQVLDYSATDKHKATLSRFDNSASLTMAKTGRWASTNSVTSLQLQIESGGFIAGSTFALYGVSA